MFAQPVPSDPPCTSPATAAAAIAFRTPAVVDDDAQAVHDHLDAAADAGVVDEVRVAEVHALLLIGRQLESIADGVAYLVQHTEDSTAHLRTCAEELIDLAGAVCES
ncbi:MAG: hypothetical protein J2P19_01840 [Pseudonocardia sp.]|nr:hypothetical protein [Pseudonocardia sp.]